MSEHIFQSLLHFSYIAVFMAVVPGAGIALVLQAAGRVGGKAACGVTLGVVFGLFFWGVAVSFGVGEILKRYPDAFLWIRRAGCIYLGYLGIKIFLDSLRQKPISGLNEEVNLDENAHGFWPFVAKASGVMIFNPELGMYDATFFPQFVSPGDNIFLFGLAFTAIEMVFIGVWYCLLGIALASWTVWRKPTVLAWADRIFSVVLLYVAFEGWK